MVPIRHPDEELRISEARGDVECGIGDRVVGPGIIENGFGGATGVAIDEAAAVANVARRIGRRAGCLLVGCAEVERAADRAPRIAAERPLQQPNSRQVHTGEDRRCVRSCRQQQLWRADGDAREKIPDVDRDVDRARQMRACIVFECLGHVEGKRLSSSLARQAQEMAGSRSDRGVRAVVGRGVFDLFLEPKAGRQGAAQSRECCLRGCVGKFERYLLAGRAVDRNLVLVSYPTRMAIVLRSSLLPRREVPNSGWLSFSRAGQKNHIADRRRRFLPSEFRGRRGNKGDIDPVV